MARAELLEMVDPGRLQQIKQTDDAPEIRAYTVGHTGNTELHLPGIGTKTFTWVQAAVKWIADKLHVGTPIFNRHDPNTNEHTGRTTIGEVVGRAYKEVGDKLSAIAAVYIYPQFKSMPLDIASIEADITFDHDTVQAWPTSVERITGIALSNSGVDSPGFPGATLIGAVQAFAVQAFAEDKTMTKDEIKAEVAKSKLKPSDLFSLDDLKADSVVETHIREEKHNVYEQNKRLEKDLDEAREKNIKVQEKYDRDLKEMQKQTVATQKSTVFKKIATERKLDEKQSAYLETALGRLETKATDDASLQDELNKFIDTGLDEYKRVAGIFGIKLDTGGDGGNGNGDANKQNQNQNQSVSPDKSMSSEELVVAPEMLSPKTNSLIPGSPIK
jgi:hypothetical protein